MFNIYPVRYKPLSLAKKALLFAIISLLFGAFDLARATQGQKAALGIIYYGMANDKTIMVRGRGYMDDAELFGDSKNLKMIFEYSKWPDGDVNGEWQRWSDSRWSTYTKENPKELGRYRYVISKKDNQANIIAHEPALIKNQEQSKNPKDNIKDLLRWVHQNHPCERYILFFHGHGDGSKGGSGFATVEDMAQGAQLIDEGENDQAKMALLKSALSNITDDQEILSRLSIIGFSSCLMQTVGVSYEMSQAVDNMVACSISMIGLDFKRTIASLIKGETVSQGTNLTQKNIDDLVAAFDSGDISQKIQSHSMANQVLNVMYDRGVALYSRNSYTSSASDTKFIRENKGKSDDIRSLLSSFSKAFLDQANGSKKDQLFQELHKIVESAQRFSITTSHFVDIYDFFDNVSKSSLPSNLKEIARKITKISQAPIDSMGTDMKSSNAALLAKSMTRNPDNAMELTNTNTTLADIKTNFRLKNSHGLSLLFPLYREAIYIKNLSIKLGTIDMPVEDMNHICTWIQEKTIAGKIEDIKASVGYYSCESQLGHFEKLQINKPSNDSGLPWTQLIRAYFEWAKAQDSNECQYMVVWKKNEDGSNQHVGYIFSKELLEKGYGFKVKTKGKHYFIRK